MKPPTGDTDFCENCGFLMAQCVSCGEPSHCPECEPDIVSICEECNEVPYE